MIDNILYSDTLIMDIEISNSGEAQNVLYSDTQGFIQDIDQVNNGSITNVLYEKNLMELVPSPAIELGYGFAG